MGTLKQFLNNSSSNLTATNSNAPANASTLNLLVDNNTAYIDSTKNGAGTALPLTLKTSGTERLRVDQSGNVVINTTALSTGATDGFLWIPSCPGTPSGSPTAPYANASALVVDSTNQNLIFRIGSKWITNTKLTGDSSSLGWNDITAEISVRGTGSNDPSWTMFRNGIYGYAFGASTMNQCWICFHVKHDYAPGTAIHLHTHWSTIGTNTGTVRWGFEYTIAKGHQQSAFPATSIVYVEQAATGTAYKHMVAETASISSAEIEPDSLILVRVFRDASHVNDTLTDLAFVFTADVHYQCDRLSTKNKAPNFYQ